MTLQTIAQILLAVLIVGTGAMTLLARLRLGAARTGNVWPQLSLLVAEGLLIVVAIHGVPS